MLFLSENLVPVVFHTYGRVLGSLFVILAGCFCYLWGLDALTFLLLASIFRRGDRAHKADYDRRVLRTYGLWAIGLIPVPLIFLLSLCINARNCVPPRVWTRWQDEDLLIRCAPCWLCSCMVPFCPPLKPFAMMNDKSIDEWWQSAPMKYQTKPKG